MIHRKEKQKICMINDLDAGFYHKKIASFTQIVSFTSTRSPFPPRWQKSYTNLVSLVILELRLTVSRLGLICMLVTLLHLSVPFEVIFSRKKIISHMQQSLFAFSCSVFCLLALDDKVICLKYYILGNCARTTCTSGVGLLCAAVVGP